LPRSLALTASAIAFNAPSSDNAAQEIATPPGKSAGRLAVTEKSVQHALSRMDVDDSFCKKNEKKRILISGNPSCLITGLF